MNNPADELSTSIVGLDIGGANIKIASADGRADDRVFPLWKRPEDLSDVLRDLVHSFHPVHESADRRLIPKERRLAVTMTGELADCFRDRQEGVRKIVDACEALRNSLSIQWIGYYGVDGNFHRPDEAKQAVDLIAAANWHALASHVAEHFSGDGWLCDVGSTTCDLIRWKKGRVQTTSRTDYDRLRQGELIYVGCRRTPVCSL
ncbi:MAG: hydantoinase/oxoprolinase family protein, partial [Planctomycetota bacterium]